MAICSNLVIPFITFLDFELVDNWFIFHVQYTCIHIIFFHVYHCSSEVFKSNKIECEERFKLLTSNLVTGPACDSVETLEEMFRSGLNICRLNLAYRTHQVKIAVIFFLHVLPVL